MPVSLATSLVDEKGFEPPTVGLQSRCSPRLSYTPTNFFPCRGQGRLEPLAWGRTGDISLTRRVLYQLSYRGMCFLPTLWACAVASRERFELSSSVLETEILDR